MKATHVVSVPPDLDVAVLDKLLGGIESTLTELGALRVWIDADGRALAVMAEFPDACADGSPAIDGRGEAPC